MKPTLKDKKEALTLIRTLLSFNFKEAFTFEKDKYGFCSLKDDEWEQEHASLIEKLNINIKRGASKVCILTSNEDWVIKINLDRSQKPYYSGINYCRTEYDNYREAVASGFGWNFAAMYSCGNIEGVEVYLQERVDLDEDTFEDSMYKYVSSCYPKESYPDADYRDQLIENSLYDCSVEDYVTAILGDGHKDLIEFLEEHSINDLHCGNWGFTGDGRIVMVDYSGFFE